MKLLLDQGLPRSAASLLRDMGIDTIHTAEIGLATAQDEAIIDNARKDNRAVVTLDSDFHALLALSRASSPSVIRIRIEGLRALALVDLLRLVIDKWETELDAGCIMTVEPRNIRIRKLPVLSPTGDAL